MGRRGLAAVTAYASAAIAGASALGAGVLAGQALLARMTIPGAIAPPPRSTGRYGLAYDGPPLRLAVLGDSLAAGYGTHHRDETTGGLLASWIAGAARRPVQLTCPAVVGAVSAWLPAQVDTALAAGVDLAIILVGANDVTTRARANAAVLHLHDSVLMLRAAGAEVVVATCPDLGTVRPIRRPLRWLARRWSRQLAAAQTVAVVRAGGRTVSLANLLGPQFDAAPDRMFGLDRFHPSVEGYRVASGVILPSALAALGLAPPEQPVGAVRPLYDAAISAAARPGTEVSSDGVATATRARSRRRVPFLSGTALSSWVPLLWRGAGQPDETVSEQPAGGNSDPEDVPSLSKRHVSDAATTTRESP